jgi:hypothetical protein
MHLQPEQHCHERTTLRCADGGVRALEWYEHCRYIGISHNVHSHCNVEKIIVHELHMYCFHPLHSRVLVYYPPYTCIALPYVHTPASFE